MKLVPTCLRKFELTLSQRLMRFLAGDCVAGFSSSVSSGDPKFIVSVPQIWVAILMIVDPTYWIPEAYCRGYWKLRVGDLGEFLCYSYAHALPVYRTYIKYSKYFRYPMHAIKQKLFTLHFTRQVKRHYEISSEIYRLFLDEEMVYTCAFYEHGDSLRSAQDRKFSKILERLELASEAPRILNIGCGWGSFERYVVRHNHAATVTGLSISRSQVLYAKQYNRESLIGDDCRRIDLFVQDIMDHNVEQKYDAIVAIGMVEHIGQSGYKSFFEKCSELVGVGGSLLIHMIVSSKSDIPTNRWIDKNIFPGGYIPSIGELTRGAESQKFRVKNIYIHYGENYAKTLADWRRNLQRNKDKIERVYQQEQKIASNASEYLYNKWEIYFAGCEATFKSPDNRLQVAHFIFERIGS